jgi:hypothetical protein
MKRKKWTKEIYMPSGSSCNNAFKSIIGKSTNADNTTTTGSTAVLVPVSSTEYR